MPAVVFGKDWGAIAHVPIHDPRCAVVDGGGGIGSWMVARPSHIGSQALGSGDERSFQMVRRSRSHRPLIGQETYGHPQHRIWESARLLRVAAFVELLKVCRNGVAWANFLILLADLRSSLQALAAFPKRPHQLA